MKIGILGTGVSGQTIGSKLVELGHDVMLGSGDEANPEAVVWAKEVGHNALYGSFMNAAEFGEIIFNCTPGPSSLEALRMAGERNLSGKILIDTANPLPSPHGPVHRSRPHACDQGFHILRVRTLIPS